MQIFLEDGTELILDSVNKYIAYVGKFKSGTDYGEQFIYPLKKALDRKIFKEDHEMIKRLSYLKKFMNMIISHKFKAPDPSVKLDLPKIAERSSSQNLKEGSSEDTIPQE